MKLRIEVRFSLTGLAKQSSYGGNYNIVQSATDLEYDRSAFIQGSKDLRNVQQQFKLRVPSFIGLTHVCTIYLHRQG